MDTRYLIDTNVIIHFLGGMFSKSTNEWLEKIIDDNLTNISVINQIEVLGFDGQLQEMQVLKEFISILNIIPLSENIVEETIQLRK